MNVSKENALKYIEPSGNFVIPVYQRNYDWKQENCKCLFNDICDIISNKSSHFIGTICSKIEGRNKTIIIDGQQRLTSLSLLLKALADESDSPTLKERIIKQYLTNPYIEDASKRIKLIPIKKDKNIYDKIVDHDLTDLNLSFFDEIEQCSNVFLNYVLFRDLIKAAITQNSFNLNDIFEAIQRLVLVEISLDNENPQLIFESLNSTGLSLTNADLLRNYLLMSLDYSEQEKLYEKYWHEIENMVNPNNMERFMLHYLIFKRRSNAIILNSKRNSLSPKNLYFFFKKQFPLDLTNIELVFKDLFKYASYYKHFVYNSLTNFSSLSPLDKVFYELFYTLDESSAAVLFMYLYELYDTNRITEDELIKVTRISISYSLRSKVCHSKSFNLQFSPLVIQKLENDFLKDSFVNIFWKAITYGKGQQAFQDDIKFKNELISQDMYSASSRTLSKYILFTLEKNGPSAKELPLYQDATIEHVLPQKLSEEWKEYLKNFDDLSNYEKSLHLFGNLALTNYNSELSNKLFDEKKEFYLKSSFAYSRELVSYNKWTSDEILSRGEYLVNKALEVWPYKEDEKESSLNMNTEYGLYGDLSLFSGIKPKKARILEQDYEVSSWSDLMTLVAKKYYEADKESFFNLIGNKEFPGNKDVISRSNAGMKRYGTISDGLYIFTNFNSEAILLSIKCIIENYDRANDTDTINEFTFSVRSN
ncbi:MAG: DUF262 domain-containing HNH endonuclease family protein [Succinivibrionaceae bacterium]|nr:DUF262 domain-containing HNH endonuclease family protein [Succinivibrionaceae bacterium]